MRLLGYLPPGVCMDSMPWVSSHLQFWRFVTPLLATLDTYYTDKYHNSYAEDGKWYAFKVEELVALAPPVVEPVEDLRVYAVE